jgi:hypothetical protein
MGEVCVEEAAAMIELKEYITSIIYHVNPQIIL